MSFGTVLLMRHVSQFESDLAGGFRRMFHVGLDGARCRCCVHVLLVEEQENVGYVIISCFAVNETVNLIIITLYSIN